MIVIFFLAMGALLVHAAPTPGEAELDRASAPVQRQVIVQKNMLLDSATAKIFWPLYNEYTEAMKKPNDRFSTLLNEYAANLMNLSDEKAKSLMDDFFSVREEQLKVKKSFAAKFLKSLPPKVVARFFQIDDKLDAIAANELAQNVPLVQ